MSVDHDAATLALARAYGGVTRLTRDLGTDDLLRPSRCRGWVVADVLFHLLCDAQRALVALASPADGPPDRDFVSYWAKFTDGSGDQAASAWWVRRSTAAFRDATGVVA